MNQYYKALTRECSLFEIKAWYEGESYELEKITGIGYFNHIFVSRNGLVTLYYNLEEAEKFDKWFEESFNEEFFHNLCTEFSQLVEQIDKVNSDKEIYKLTVKMWPALFFFDELSKYPELGNDSMVRRLIRIRASTESASYILADKVSSDINYPKDYVFYKGEIYYEDFESFCRVKKVIIVN